MYCPVKNKVCTVLSNWAGGRLDLFHHAPSEARRNLPNAARRAARAGAGYDLAALRATLGRWEDCVGLPVVHDEKGRAVPPLNLTVILDPILTA